MKDTLQKLRDEHQLILKMFEDKTDILEIIHFVEDEHHPLEEQVLFPAVANHPLLSQGGPLCTFFRGMELDLTPQKSVRDYLQHLYAQGFPKPEPYRSFDWLTPQNPLSLPMEEHDLGHEISSVIKTLRASGHIDRFPDVFERLSREYESLLRRHIAKEDGCLFILCEKLLS